jgi:hypothetical protein
MDNSIAEQFVILALNPEKGSIAIPGIHFRYSLSGAILMDYLAGEEFRVEEKRVIPSLRLNDEAIHALFSDMIMKSSRNRRISYWVRRLTTKSRFIFSEMTRSLEKQGIIQIEQKKFLNIFPYKRYWFKNKSVREKIIEEVRNILIRGRQPGKKDLMLLGIIEASAAYRLISKERGETGLLRKKNKVLLKGNVMSIEISQAIREVQEAVTSSVIAASMASHASH